MGWRWRVLHSLSLPPLALSTNEALEGELPSSLWIFHIPLLHILPFARNRKRLIEAKKGFVCCVQKNSISSESLFKFSALLDGTKVFHRRLCLQCVQFRIATLPLNLKHPTDSPGSTFFAFYPQFRFISVPSNYIVVYINRNRIKLKLSSFSVLCR
jgi:hypothetical protein